MTSKVERNKTDIERCLRENRALQSLLHTELERVGQLQSENRKNAATLIVWLSSKETLNLTSPDDSNMQRPWTRSFFTHDGDAPEPNEDTKKRRVLEDQTFFHHKQPPFSQKEIKILLQIVKETSSNTDKVDFERITAIFNQRVRDDTKTAVRRTAIECKILYENQTRKNQAFSKEEAMKIYEQVYRAEGTPNWEEIAASLGNGRTAWDCLVAYQTKLKQSQPEPWSIEQDQLLLKYIGAAGPQFVIDGAQINHMGPRLLPGKSKSQINTRINQSLLNPNLTHGPWTDGEERMLAICMKIYRDSPHSLSMASSHIPHRATASVSDKWQRSLDPAYSTKPFTKAEDRALRDAVAKDPDAGWTEISRKYFPHRHPHRLSNRFSEMARDEELLQKSNHDLMKKMGKRKGAETQMEAALSPDDFLIQVKKKTI